MNYFKIFIGLSLTFILFLSNTLHSQVVSTELFVAGNCDMCEERILNAVDVKGVRASSWSPSDQILRITYKTEKVSLQDLCAELTKVGHDTEYILAKDEVYDELHTCCKFVRIPQDSIKPYPNQ